jgi:SAD/SRA domain
VAQRLFGHVPGYPVGSHFASRTELSEAGVHRPTVAGISGGEQEGADSIVLSGGYETIRTLATRSSTRAVGDGTRQHKGRSRIKTSGMVIAPSPTAAYMGFRSE